jgi:hypothetical protein
MFERLVRAPGETASRVRPTGTLLPRTRVRGNVWSPAPFPGHPSIRVDPPQSHPTPLSIAGVPGEVSRQRVASFFPIASHCWLGAAGSHGRQGARPCRGTPIVRATMPSAEGSTMSIPAFQGSPSSSCQRFVNLSMRNAVYRLKYI